MVMGAYKVLYSITRIFNSLYHLNDTDLHSRSHLQEAAKIYVMLCYISDFWLCGKYRLVEHFLFLTGCLEK